MAAFSAHQLYRPQLKVLARRGRNTQLVEGLLARTGTHARVRHLAGILRAGARPYAQIWFAGLLPCNALFALSVYAKDDDVDKSDPTLVATQQDPILGTLALARIERDSEIPGVRALTRLPILRINRYRPGRRLLVRLEGRGDNQGFDALDLRSPHIASALAADFDAAARLLAPPTLLPPRLLKRVSGIAYRRPDGRLLSMALKSADATDAIRALAKAHGKLSLSQLHCHSAQAADHTCWTSISTLEHLARAQPGLSDLATTLIGSVTTSHARHPGDTPVTSLGLNGIDGWLYDHQRVNLLGPAHLVRVEAEWSAASVREALMRTAPANAERLFDSYCETYARYATALRPRVIRLYRSHHFIARALGEGRRLDPYGDEAARACLLEALRLTT